MIKAHENPLYEQVRELIEGHNGVLGNGIIGILNNYTSQLNLDSLVYVYSAVSDRLNFHFQFSGDTKLVSSSTLTEDEISKRENRMMAWLSIQEDRIRLLADCSGMSLERLNEILGDDSDNVTVKNILNQ